MSGPETANLCLQILNVHGRRTSVNTAKPIPIMEFSRCCILEKPFIFCDRVSL